jgi:hypothetical protein
MVSGSRGSDVYSRYDGSIDANNVYELSPPHTNDSLVLVANHGYVTKTVSHSRIILRSTKSVGVVHIRMSTWIHLNLRACWAPETSGNLFQDLCKPYNSGWWKRNRKKMCREKMLLRTHIIKGQKSHHKKRTKVARCVKFVYCFPT